MDSYLSTTQFENAVNAEIRRLSENIVVHMDEQLLIQAKAFVGKSKDTPIEMIYNGVLTRDVINYISNNYISRGWYSVTGMIVGETTVFTFLLVEPIL